MEKAKRKRKEKAKRGQLALTIPFEFHSMLPFEECRDRLYRLERYSVEVFPAQTVEDTYEVSEFRVVANGVGVEAVGHLRAGLEELTTNVEGYVGVRRPIYAGYIFLIGVSVVLFLAILFQPRFGLFSSVLCCVAWIAPLMAMVTWFHDFGQRNKLPQHLREVLEAQRPSND